MRRVTTWLFLGVLPAALLTVLGIGCSGGDQTTKKNPNTGSETPAAKPVEFKGRGTIKGKVVLDNHKKPDFSSDNTAFQGKINKNPEVCLAADAGPEKDQQTWRIGEAGEVEFAVIFVKPPENQYFKMDDSDLSPDKAGWGKEVIIDQPHCAFVPHVAVTFPSHHTDAETTKKTDQVVRVINSAPISHNTKSEAIGFNKLLPAMDKKGAELTLTPNSDKPTDINCDIHPWMAGKIWAFDHPYAKATGKDGTFEIKNVPAGVKLMVVGWHEGPGVFEKGKEIELKDGDTKDLGEMTIKSPK